jgi:hypothetical protein
MAHNSGSGFCLADSRTALSRCLTLELAGAEKEQGNLKTDNAVQRDV